MAREIPKWFPVAGYISGLFTLVFFMYVALFQPGPPTFAHIIVMALGVALAVTFLGGEAAANGAIDMPVIKNNPLAFSATGGIAVFIIALLLGWTLFPTGESDLEVHDGDFQFAVGTIGQPTDQTLVKATFEAAGTAKRIEQKNVYLWIAVEINGKIWPKESGIVLDQNGNWRAPVFEDGRPEQFELSLWAANRQANARLHEYLEDGSHTGQYPDFHPLTGMKRLARVERLRVSGN